MTSCNCRFMMERIKEEDVVRQFNVSLPGEEEEPEAMFPYLLRQLTEVIALQKIYIFIVLS